MLPSFLGKYLRSDVFLLTMDPTLTWSSGISSSVLCLPIPIDIIVSADVLIPPVDLKGLGVKGLASRVSAVSAPPNPPAAEGAVNLPDL